MAKAVTLTFEAKLGQAIDSMSALARRIGTLEKSTAKLTAATAKAVRTMEQVGTAGERAGQRTQTAFERGLQSVKNYAAGFLGAQGVLMLLRSVNRELEVVAERQRQFAATQITLGQATAELRRNMPGATPEEMARVQRIGGTIAAEVGVPERFVQRGMAQALSASGGDVEASRGAVRAAAMFLRSQPEAIGGYAGSLLDIQQVTGTTDPDVNLGMMSFVAGRSRVVDPKMQAESIPSALIGLKGFGATQQQGAALFASLTRAAAERTGKISGTGAIRMAEQLEQFLPEVPTMGGRIAALQADPELARVFLEGGQIPGRRWGEKDTWAAATFRAKVKSPIRALLRDPGSLAAGMYAATLAELPGAPGLAELGRMGLEGLRADPLEKTAGLQRGLASIGERLQVAQPAQARIGIIRDNLRQLLRDSGVDALTTWGVMRVFDVRTGLGADPSELASDLLSERAGRLADPYTVAPVFGTRGMRREGGATAEERAMSGLLQDAAENIRRTAAGVERQRGPELRPLEVDDREGR